MGEYKLASAGDNIKFWDLRKFALVKQFNPHSGNVSSICWGHDNNFLVSASSIGDKIAVTYPNNPAYSFDIATEEEKSCIELNSTSKYVTGGGADGLIHIWDLKARKLKMTYKEHKAKVTSIQFNWNDTVIASGSESGEIILYSVVTGIGYSPLVVPKAQAVRQVQYSHLKKSLLGSVSDDGAVNLWDTSSKRLLHSFVGSHKAPAMGLAFSPLNLMLLMSVGLDKRIVCYDIVGKCPVKTMSAESPMTSIDLMMDGATFAAGTTRGKIYIYDLRQGATPIKILTAHKSSVQSLKFQHGAKTGQPEIGGKARSSNSSVQQVDHDVVTDTNAVNNNLTDGTKDLTNGTPVKSRSPLDNEAQGSHMSTDDHEYSPLKDDVLSPLSDNANLSRGSHQSSSARSNIPLAKTQSHADEVGFTDDEAKLYGMDDFTNTTNHKELQSRIPSTNGPQSATAAMKVTSHEGDFTAADHPVSDSAEVVHEVIHSTKSSGAPANYSTASYGYMSTSSSKANKISPAGSPFKGAEGVTKKSTHVKTNVKECPKSMEYAKTTSKLTVPEKASMITPPEAGPSSGVAGAAVGSSLQPFHTQFIRNIVMDAMEEFHDQIRQDILNLHTELIKQFFIQQAEIERLVRQHSINDELLAEIQRLQEENRRLKKKF